MAKKYFAFPSVLLTGIGGDDVIIVDPSSGQGTPDDIFPCEFSTWLAQFGEDIDHDGDKDMEDYRQWWLANRLPADAWAAINPGIDLNTPIANP